MKNYEQVAIAAETLITNKTRDKWALADAIHDTVSTGNRNKLDQLSKLLIADGFTYGPYEVFQMWQTAHDWPVSKRRSEAAYSTHQGCDPKGDDGATLLVLCAVVRGEQVDRPKHIAALNWGLLCDRIKARKRLVRVTADDMRFARLVESDQLTARMGRSGRLMFPEYGPIVTRELDDEVLAAIGNQSALTAWLSAERFVNAAVTTIKDDVPNEVREVIERVQAAINEVFTSA